MTQSTMIMMLTIMKLLCGINKYHRLKKTNNTLLLEGVHAQWVVGHCFLSNRKVCQSPVIQSKYFFLNFTMKLCFIIIFLNITSVFKKPVAPKSQVVKSNDDPDQCFIGGLRSYNPVKVRDS